MTEHGDVKKVVKKVELNKWGMAIFAVLLIIGLAYYIAPHQVQKSSGDDISPAVAAAQRILDQGKGDDISPAVAAEPINYGLILILIGIVGLVVITYRSKKKGKLPST